MFDTHFSNLLPAIFQAHRITIWRSIFQAVFLFVFRASGTCRCHAWLRATCSNRPDWVSIHLRSRVASMPHRRRTRKTEAPSLHKYMYMYCTNVQYMHVVRTSWRNLSCWQKGGLLTNTLYSCPKFTNMSAVDGFMSIHIHIYVHSTLYMRGAYWSTRTNTDCMGNNSDAFQF